MYHMDEFSDGIQVEVMLSLNLEEAKTLNVNDKAGGLKIMKGKREIRKLITYAVKIALGSSLAIYLAQLFDLKFAASAGSITLLTIVTSKWETLKLSACRILSFGIAVVFMSLIEHYISIEWVTYGIFILIFTLICECLGWKTTLSVNAVIATHFLTMKSVSAEAVLNEFWLLAIGISIAVIMNLFHWNNRDKKEIIANMRFTEERLQFIVGELAIYLSNKELNRNVWDDIISLEKKLHDFIQMAQEYQNNTFVSHPQYYIDYFEMRLDQCHVLHNLHYEVKKMRSRPKQAKVIAEYLNYMQMYVTEVNIPVKQLNRLHEIFEKMKEENMPATREEFESRARLYHILMDIEEFLIFKKRFVEELEKEQIDRYWGK